MTDLVGQEIGRYQLRALIGRGRLGTVYRAYDPTFQREVALKVVAPRVVSTPRFAERFADWGRRVAGLAHPRILPIYDFEVAGDVAYVAMRLALGSLAEVTAASPLSESDAGRMLAQVGEALEYAHRQGLVHGHLTPRNILYDRTLNWQVADFGQARLLDALMAAGDVQTGDLANLQPAYLAPEQIRGETPRPETDVYALGSLAYELVTARPLFSGDTAMAVMLRHLEEAPADPRHFNPRVSPELGAALLNALAKAPEARTITASELGQRCQRALAGMAQVVKEAPVAPATPAAVAQERLLEAALKRHVPVHKSTELVVLIRRLNARGLEQVLADDESYVPTREDVRGRSVSVDFPLDAQARPQPAELLLRINAPDFAPPAQEKRLRLAPDRDAGPFEFLLAPERTGDLVVTVEVFQDGLFLGNGRLHTTGEPGDRPATAEARQVVALPLVVNVYQQIGGVNIQSEGDVTIGGDVVGRDKADVASIGQGEALTVKKPDPGGGGSTHTPSLPDDLKTTLSKPLSRTQPSGCLGGLLRWLTGGMLVLLVLAVLWLC